jgi:hypothetical protein
MDRTMFCPYIHERGGNLISPFAKGEAADAGD